MEWAEDLFTLKKSAKKGRRAAGGASTEENSAAQIKGNPSVKKGDSEEKSSQSRNNSFEDELAEFDLAAAPKPKKAGGWADEPIKSGKNKQPINIIEQERFSSSLTTANLSDDDIPIIPDLDDLQDDLLLNEMVEAPVVSVNRVATYKELNSELLKQGAFASLEEIDLSILARCLQNEALLTEPDDEWTWEQLFTEVSADIHADKPKSADIGTTKFVH